jgi:hypothetical protein
MPFPILAALPIIGDIFKGVFGTIDALHTSTEEKLTLQQQMFGLQVSLTEKFLDFQTRMVEAQAKVITAEATSDSWLAKNWRPLTMLTFVALVVFRWTGILQVLGFPPVTITEAIEKELWLIIQIGIGGYIGGRSVEKVAEVVGAVITKKNGNGHA